MGGDGDKLPKSTRDAGSRAPLQPLTSASFVDVTSSNRLAGLFSIAPLAHLPTGIEVRDAIADIPASAIEFDDDEKAALVRVKLEDLEP